MLSALQSANLALRFLLELCMLAALAYWGFRTGSSTPIKVLLGIGAPLLAAIIWGLLLSPRAAVRLAAPVQLLLEILLFGAAAAALFAAGRPALAWVLGVAFVINRLLLYLWHQ